ncbi:M20/M25/M40 family metallo-hydrolase [Sphingomonas sp. IW22]|uniref:M20/M25/M40 family metallo-hydrolase n=1 Tax=Sphingomonas sp. IW22 TaxID=3242489 RepID=UPI003522F9DF
MVVHLDHVGTGGHAKGDDKVFNGAMDNAAGVATMLEAARAFTQAGEKPKRTILFAAVTSEEDGLLGSQYLAKHPLPGVKVTSVVNLDMPVLLYDFTDVVAFGAEHSTMGPIVAKATSDMGIKLSPDPMPEENLFTRSDHYRFVTEGVPSVFLVTGFANGGEKAFKDFLATNYHKPSDEVSLPFNWGAGAKFAKVNYNIARALADAPTAPVWYDDSEFGKLYAADAAKAERPAGG